MTVLLPTIVEPILILGSVVQSGAYVLGICLETPLALSFGRFQGGRPLTLNRGWFAYAGSAMGQHGSSSLARRLLRHATRSDGLPPHSVRPALLASLRDAGMGPDPLLPPDHKTLSWHIDYLLQEPDVALKRVLAVRSSQRLEQTLAGWLAGREEAQPVAAGLGASDHPGHTHLFQLTDPSAIWPALVDYAASL